MKRHSLAAVSVLFAILVIVAIGRSGERKAEETAAQPSAKGAPKSQRPTRSVVAAGERLRKLLGEKPPEMSFLAIEAAVKTLSEEERQALIREVWPRGIEGYAGWLRCALFAEWGRRDPERALAFLADPPPLPYPKNHWAHAPEEGPHRFSVFRGWGEVDPEAALARLQTQVDTITGWHEAASREVMRELARQEGLAAWEKVPVEWGRGGALQGLFRGLKDPADRLAAVNRWLPELDWQAGVAMPIGLGYRLGPKSLEKERFRAQYAHARSDFFFDAALALGELDLAMAVDWVRENSPAEKDRVVSAYLRRWAAEFPEQAQAELHAGCYSTDDLLMGLIRGDPERAPELIRRIDDSAKLELVFDLSIRWAPRLQEKVWGSYPTAHDPPVRQEAGAAYHGLQEAIERAGFEEGVVKKFHAELDSRFFDYRKAAGLNK